MGIFTSFLAYRAGKNRTRRQKEAEIDDLLEFADETCDNCGYRRAQHSDDGTCPSYD